MNRRAFLLSMGAAVATAAYTLPKAHASEFCSWKRGIQGIDPRAYVALHNRMYYFQEGGIYAFSGTPYNPQSWSPL